jgi:hypothetical protein
MVEESVTKREAAYKGELGQLCYERFRLVRQCMAAEEKIVELDLRITALETAIHENQATQSDLKTQRSIDDAKGETHAS